MKNLIIIVIMLVSCNSTIIAGGPKPSAYLHVSRTFDNGQYHYMCGVVFKDKDMARLIDAVDLLDEYYNKNHPKMAARESAKKRLRKALERIRFYNYCPDEDGPEHQKYPSIVLSSDNIDMIVNVGKYALNK